MQKSVHFDDAIRKNLEYQKTYGTYKNADSPNWTGSEGDRAALMRSSFPSVQANDWQRSQIKNIHLLNYLSSGTMGQYTNLSQITTLQGNDDFDVQPKLTSVAQETGWNTLKVSQPRSIIDGDAKTLTGIAIVVSTMGLLFFMK